MFGIAQHEITIDFRTKLKAQLDKATEELLAVKDQEPDSFSEIIEIKVGCRVKATDPRYLNRQGRVWGIRNLEAQVNLDGNANYANIPLAKLINLSSIGEARRESSVFYLNSRIAQLKNILQDIEIPEILFTAEYHIIQICKQFSFENPDRYHFIHSFNLNTYSTKMPSHLVSPDKFYQVRCSASDFIDICPSSELAFKLRYASQFLNNDKNHVLTDGRLFANNINLDGGNKYSTTEDDDLPF